MREDIQKLTKHKAEFKKEKHLYARGVIMGIVMTLALIAVLMLMGIDREIQFIIN